jgi:hypothetical protein
MDITLTLHIDEDQGEALTWGQLEQIVSYNLPANADLVVAPTHGPFVIDAGRFGMSGVLTVDDRLAEARDKTIEAVAEWLEEQTPLPLPAELAEELRAVKAKI